MTPKKRVLTVFRGEVPDSVPWFADLSYWFAAENHSFFVLISTVGRDLFMIHVDGRFRGALSYLGSVV